MACVLAVGCGSSGSKKAEDKKPDHSQDPKLPEKVTITQPVFTIYGPAPKHELYYTIQGSQAQASLETNALQSGVLTLVTGTIHRDGETRFSADNGKAAKTSPDSEAFDLLTLSGHVAIHSQNPAGNLYCDQLFANMKTHMIYAKGHVRFDTANGLIGTLPEAWATQNLSKIASPELFPQLP